MICHKLSLVTDGWSPTNALHYVTAAPATLQQKAQAALLWQLCLAVRV
jgi:hypothetical protein